ncbi:hypothetical protein KFK09_028179 [Dendrobium nobile]|uniref:Uncharacterized protein n=1 Tax=Dendrobium nobile TaxID=94219 RepID=A0A8T3A2V7_DENNO|nr:hypothetical protein KFK09_028179 [Dendrobium nobile]
MKVVKYWKSWSSFHALDGLYSIINFGCSIPILVRICFRLLCEVVLLNSASVDFVDGTCMMVCVIYSSGSRHIVPLLSMESRGSYFVALYALFFNVSLRIFH